MLTKTSLLRSYKLPVLANYGVAQTAWRTVDPTPHPVTVPRDKTDNKHLRQSKNAIELYDKSTRPKTGDVTSSSRSLEKVTGEAERENRVLQRCSVSESIAQSLPVLHQFFCSSRVCVLLLQDLLQSCARGGRRRVVGPLRNPVL
jgi:hypothetical protein